MTLRSAELFSPPANAGGRAPTMPATAVAALLIAAGAAAVVLGAVFFQYVVGIQPCPLCYQQRISYYVAVPLALLVAFAAGRRAPSAWVAAGFVLLTLVFLVTAGIGVYHSGVEWGFWPGPADCTGPVAEFGTAGSLLNQMQKTVVVRCDVVQWRLFGLSLAGYNVLTGSALALIAGWGFVRSRRQPV